MAMNGSFAGGLADGLRNGMAIAQAYDLSKERRRQREVDEKLAAVQLNDDSAQQAPGAIGLQRMPVSAPGSSALTANAPAGSSPYPLAIPLRRRSRPLRRAGWDWRTSPLVRREWVWACRSPRVACGRPWVRKKSPPAVDYLGVEISARSPMV